MVTVNVYTIVMYDVITVDYCKCILLYSPLNSYVLYVHWILDFKKILLLLLLLKLENICEGIKIKGHKDRFFCDVCTKGKQAYAAINTAPDDHTKAPLQMVHSDLAVPITPTAKGGFRYAICFVDAYSGFVSHYFMRNKSDATRVTVRFLADVSAIGTVKVLRTDNGGEYTSNEFKDLLVNIPLNMKGVYPICLVITEPQKGGGTLVLTWFVVYYWRADCLNHCGLMH